MKQIGTRREFFWDEQLVDTQRTTAERRLHHPVRRDVVLRHDAPWEGDGCDFHNILFIPETGVYRMYYNAYRMLDPNDTERAPVDLRVCCCESRDGVHWVKPALGVRAFNGNRENNIVADGEMFPGITCIDNFYVMLDDNPDRVVPERYKAVMRYTTLGADGLMRDRLDALISDDGYTFRKLGTVTEQGRFDTLNIVLWNGETREYLCYIRDFHTLGADGELLDVDHSVQGAALNLCVRDIRVLSSKDFLHWTTPEHLRYNEVEDYPLYTSCVSRYPGSPEMLVGFPTRYVERMKWTPNFSRLLGAEKRRARCAVEPRLGLALTDCVFMCSRDGREWVRYDEVFIAPEPENGLNWVYGDCYPAVGLVKTKSALEGADDELSMYLFEKHWMDMPAELARYTIRRDGFVSLGAGIAEKTIVTKPFSFEGDRLTVNFATSARGYLYLALRDVRTGETLSSGELFGNRTDRIVDFDGDVRSFAGREIVLECVLCDADLYSFRFEADDGR